MVKKVLRMSEIKLNGFQRYKIIFCWKLNDVTVFSEFKATFHVLLFSLGTRQLTDACMLAYTTEEMTPRNSQESSHRNDNVKTNSREMFLAGKNKFSRFQMKMLMNMKCKSIEESVFN